jgi:hypothetical protein
MKNESFMIDIKKIHIASSAEDSISKTIEELLDINKRITQRTNTERKETTEKQFDKEDYSTKKTRGEKEEVTERQFGKRDEADLEIVEIRLEETKPEDLGHDEKKWDKDKEKVRGHRHVSPMWQQIYKQEDERKKLDKGQLKKKLKK